MYSTSLPFSFLITCERTVRMNATSAVWPSRRNISHKKNQCPAANNKYYDVSGDTLCNNRHAGFGASWVAADSEMKFYNNEKENNKNKSFSYTWKEINVFLWLETQCEKGKKPKLNLVKRRNNHEKRDYIEETRGRVYKREPSYSCN